MSEALENVVRDDLYRWRDNELLEKFYPGTCTLSGATLLGDDVIEKLAKCGERIGGGEDLARHIRWPIGLGIESIDTETHHLTAYGEALLARLQTIYTKYDQDVAAQEAQLRSLPSEVSTQSLYEGSSTQNQKRQRSRTVNSDEERTPTESTNEETTTDRQRGRGAKRGRSAEV
jgi:hypothetical protein